MICCLPGSSLHPPAILKVEMALGTRLCAVFLAQYLTLPMPLSTPEYKWVPANYWGNMTIMAVFLEWGGEVTWKLALLSLTAKTHFALYSTVMTSHTGVSLTSLFKGATSRLAHLEKLAIFFKFTIRNPS